MKAGLQSLKPHLGLMIAGSAAFSMSTLFSAMKPVLLTRFVEETHYPQSLAGLIVAAPFVGGVLAALFMHAILQRLRYRQAAIVFSGALVLCELLNSFVFSVPALVLVAQLVSGFAVGALMGFAAARIARTDDPDPIFGFVDMTGVLLMSFFIAGIGAAVEAQGLVGGFRCAFVIAIALSAFTLAYRPDEENLLAADAAPLVLHWRPLLIVAMGVLFVSFSGLGFTYMFTIARNLGFSYESAGAQIGLILFFSAFACAAGGWCSARFGPFWPLMGAFASCAIGWWIAIHTASPITFLAALVPAIYALQFAYPILLALAGAQDAQGQWAAIAAPINASGFAWAAISSGMIVERFGIPALATVTLVGMLVCAAMLTLTRKPALIGQPTALREQEN